jgi:hypothetical protein
MVQAVGVGLCRVTGETLQCLFETEVEERRGEGADAKVLETFWPSINASSDDKLSQHVCTIAAAIREEIRNRCSICTCVWWYLADERIHDVVGEVGLVNYTA